MWKVQKNTAFTNCLFVSNTVIFADIHSATRKNMFELCQLKNAACAQKVLLHEISGENYITVASNSFHLASLMQNWFGAAEHLTTSQGVRNIFLSAQKILNSRNTLCNIVCISDNTYSTPFVSCYLLSAALRFVRPIAVYQRHLMTDCS